MGTHFCTTTNSLLFATSSCYSLSPCNNMILALVIKIPIILTIVVYRRIVEQTIEKILQEIKRLDLERLSTVCRQLSALCCERKHFFKRRQIEMLENNLVYENRERKANPRTEKNWKETPGAVTYTWSNDVTSRLLRTRTTTTSGNCNRKKYLLQSRQKRTRYDNGDWTLSTGPVA